MFREDAASVADVEREILPRILAAGVEASRIPVANAEISEAGRLLAAYRQDVPAGARVERDLDGGRRCLRLEGDAAPETLQGLAERLAPHLKVTRNPEGVRPVPGPAPGRGEGESGDFEHRIRTRLTVARGWVELLRSDHLGRERQEQALEITSRQLADIERLLRARKVAAADHEPRLGRADLATAVRHCLRDSAWSANAQVDGPLIFGWPRELLVEADQVRDVLLHLLDNATEHTPAGSRVEVRLEYEPAEVRLSVEDDGPGFPGDFETGLGTGSRVVDRLAMDLGATVIRGRSEHLGGAAVRLLWGS